MCLVYVNWSNFESWTNDLISTLENIKCLENSETDCTLWQRWYSKDMQHKPVRMTTILLLPELEFSAVNWYMIKESEKTNFQTRCYYKVSNSTVHYQVLHIHYILFIILLHVASLSVLELEIKWAVAASFCTAALVMGRSIITVFWANHWKCQNIFTAFWKLYVQFILEDICSCIDIYT